MAGESVIRKALKDRVEAYGGEVRAASWLGRRNAPDVFVLLYEKLIVERNGGFKHVKPANFWVETKAPGGKPNKAQAREHKRMREAGCVVTVIATIARLDELLPPLKL